MALTQEQVNIDLAFKAVKANINSANAAIASKADGATTTAALANKANLIGGKLDPAQVPDVSITDFLGTVATQTAMLALVGQKGDWCIRSDDGKVYLIIATPTNVIGSWQALSYPAVAALDNYNYAAAYNAA